MNDDWLSTGDVADMLGFSRQHVVDLCDRGDLPCVRIGTHRRIRRTDLTNVVEPRLTREQEKSLWLHRVVLGALMVDPDNVLRAARGNVDRWRQAHRQDGMSRHYLDRWERAIDGGVDDVAEILIGTDGQSLELRQNSPFAGVIPDRQRQQVLRSFRRHWQRTHENVHAR